MLLSAALMGDALNYPLGGFNSSGLSLNGAAEINSSNYTNLLQLANGTSGGAGSAFSQAIGVAAFSSDFSFQINSASSNAAGLAFVIQGTGSTATGAGADGSTGMPDSMALSFDVSDGTGQTLLTSNGVSSAATQLDALGIHPASGDSIDVNLEYDGKTLLVTETDETTLASASQSYTVNIPGIAGSNAYVGFTGAGGATDDVLNWEFADQQPTQSNIGNAGGGGGSFSYQVGGQYTVSGAGVGFGAWPDQVNYLWQPITGDSTIVALVTSPPTGTAGLMLRDSLATNSAFAFVAMNGSGIQFKARSVTGGATMATAGIPRSGSAEYLELVSDGPTVSGYVSTTGMPGSWTLVGTSPIQAMSDHSLSGAMVGLTVASWSATENLTFHFSDVSLSANAPIGVDTGDAGVDYLEDDQMWVNVIKEASGFSVAGENGTPVSVDANGWPTADFTIPAIMQEYSDSGGVYTLSMQVAQNPTITVYGGKLSNQVYNAATQTLTANIAVGTSGTLALTVTNTDGGARNIEVLRPGYSLTNTPVFTTQYLNFLESLHPTILRFMNFTVTNNNPVQTWAQRTLPSAPMQTGTLPLMNYDGTENADGSEPTGIAWEYAIMLANAVHADMWINIPAEADDEYVEQLASLIKNGDTVDGVTYPPLDPDLNVYIEYSNEVWNPGFAANGYATAAAVSEVVTDAQNGTQSNLNYDDLSLAQNSIGYVNAPTWEARWAARRLMQISNLFASVFGESAINTRIRPVLANEPDPSIQADQLAYINAVFGAPSNYFYAVATATYANMNGPNNTPNTVNGGNNNPNMTVTDVLNNLSMNSYALTSLYDSLDSVAQQYGLQMDGYESGPDLSGFQGTGADGVKVEAENSPLFTNFLEQYYQDWFANGGGAIIYYGGYARAWGQKYGDFQITNAIGNLDDAKEIGFRAVAESERPQIVPPIPQGLQAKAVSQTQVDLTWQSDPQASEFLIEASPNSAFASDVITQIAPAGSTSWTFSGLLAGVTYYFQAAAQTDAGPSNPSNEVHATTTGALVPPAPPTNLTASVVNTSTVQLNWVSNSLDETGFTVLVATNAAMTQNLLTLSAAAGTTQLMVEDLNAQTTYYFSVAATNAAGASSAAASSPVTTPAATPIGVYTFSEGSGTTVLDTSGYGTAANGTIVGGVTRVAGPEGLAALDFDGSTGYVNLGTPAKYNLTGQITVSAWIKPTAVNSQGDIIDQDWDGLDNPFYLAVLNSDTVEFGTYRFRYDGDSPVNAIGQSPTPLTNGQWYFIAGVYDGSELKVYVDGQLVGATADPYGVTPGTEPTEIGRDANDGGGSWNYFDGDIADVQIFNAGLSDADIAALAGVSVVDLPTAANETYSTTENDALVESAPGVLGKAYDPYGLPLIASLINGPSDGTLTFNANGSFSYTPSANFVGTDSFTYDVSDSVGDSQPATVTIDVTPSPVSNFAGTVSGDSVVLSWSDNFAGLTGYTLQQSTDGVDWHTIASPPAGSIGYTVTGLTPGQMYLFQISAGSGVGGSPNVQTPAFFVGTVAAGPIVETTTSSSTQISGKWWISSSIPGYYGNEYLNDGQLGKGTKSVTFNFNVTEPGNYEVAVWYPAAAGNAPSVPVEIITSGGTYLETIDEQTDGGQWVDLGVLPLSAGTAQVQFTTGNTTGLVVVNAAELAMTSAPATSPPASFTAVAASQTSIDLSWVASTTATGYVLQQSSDGINWTTIPANLISSTVAYTVSGLTPGGMYYYRIQSTGTAGSSVFVEAGPIVTPEPPTVISTISSSSTPQVTWVGKWWASSSIPGYYGSEYLNDGNQGKGTKSVTFNVALPEAGTYDVYTWYPATSTNAASVPVSIVSASGTSNVTVDEEVDGGQWVLLGTYAFDATGQVIFNTTGTTGLVVVNAVKLVMVE
ncbi:MAG TPA: fibronectin type III domain-containing protein [Tepidisphaeraceae bacterium]|nr:fibronectin type III domain-containing protein [Tepidisphaeraceae bacterium]